MSSTKRAETVYRPQGKFLTFRLASEVYGAEIQTVREIVGLLPITPVPNTPNYIRGVVNLRGKIIPVLDLRLKFKMQAPEATSETCIIVFELHHHGKPLLIGTWVDSVCEVITIDLESIEPAPSFGARVDTAFIRGLVRTKDAAHLLLHIDKVLTHEDQETMATAAEAPADGDAARTVEHPQA